MTTLSRLDTEHANEIKKEKEQTEKTGMFGFEGVADKPTMNAVKKENLKYKEQVASAAVVKQTETGCFKANAAQIEVSPEEEKPRRYRLVNLAVGEPLAGEV